MRVRAAALAAVALALAACGAKDEPDGQGTGARTSAGAAKAAGSPAARPGARLTDAQLAGQHVVFPFAGRTPPPALLREEVGLTPVAVAERVAQAVLEPSLA